MKSPALLLVEFKSNKKEKGSTWPVPGARADSPHVTTYWIERGWEQLSTIPYNKSPPYNVDYIL